MKNFITPFLFVFILIPSLKAAVVTVYVYNVEFSTNMPGNPVNPAVITQGDSIRWVWVQGGHTTTSVAGSPEQWNQPINSSNTDYVRAFNTTGVYWYYCIPHGTDNGDGTASGMSSTITVLPAGSGACCLSNGICIMTTEGSCLSQNGFFSGPGTLCDTTTCTATVEFPASKDNILYESPTGSLSNALGSHLYTGNNTAGKRRSVVAFDLSGIPGGAEVQNANVQLYCNSSSGNAVNVTAQKLLQNWGEGTSQANGNEGNGASATTGDATWLHTFYTTSLWNSTGGSFSGTISATTNVTGQGSFFSWNTPQTAADVQGWLDNPATNSGWIFRGDENVTSNTKRFSSRQNSTVANRPKLILTYQVPPHGACCLPDASCELLTQNQCMTAGGTYQGDGTSCEAAGCSVQLTPFLDPLPIPGIAVPVTGNSGGAAHYRIEMTEQFQSLHSQLPPTRVWGYNGSYPGPVIEAFRDSLVTVRWINNLRVFETGALRTTHVLTIDTCLHGPDMTGQVPVGVVHLHGGKVPHDSDGYPEEAFPPGDSSAIYTYPNKQPAAMLWYHDHALGITRLNVMMGMAGLYYLRDSNELSLNLPAGEYEIPLVLQDKSFNPDGTMIYHEMFEDHFFGDFILVNGKVWPYLQVKKGKYRFRLLNGSNSRVYKLALSNGAFFWEIGTDLGLKEIPVLLDSLILLPGERYDIIIDFSSYATGTEIVLTNQAPSPYPGFSGVGVIPNVMKFIVQAANGFTGAIADTLAQVETLMPENAAEERIFELMTMPGPVCNGMGMPMWSINGLMWNDLTEFPVYGSTEIWTWHNQSGISHPMHMHLVAFQILDRQALNDVTGLPEGPLLPPAEQEKGWKDTAHSPPGYRTRVIARFDGFTGLFPYHCHILEHEDHEMMRQFEVIPCQWVTTTGNQGPGSLRYAVDCAANGDTILFDAALAGDTIRLTDSLLLNKDLHILNLSGPPVTLDGRLAYRLLHVEEGHEVTLYNLHLVSGSATFGRALVNLGQIMLDTVDVYDVSDNPFDGPSLLNRGILQIRNHCRLYQQP